MEASQAVYEASMLMLWLIPFPYLSTSVLQGGESQSLWMALVGSVVESL